MVEGGAKVNLARRSFGFLGVYTVNNPSGDRDGARVTSITAGQPAASAGIRVGDVIVAVNNQRVATQPDLGPILRAQTPGRPVVIGLRRNGQILHRNVVLADRVVWQVPDAASVGGTSARERDELARIEQQQQQTEGVLARLARVDANWERIRERQDWEQVRALLGEPMRGHISSDSQPNRFGIGGTFAGTQGLRVYVETNREGRVLRVTSERKSPRLRVIDVSNSWGDAYEAEIGVWTSRGTIDYIYEDLADGEWRENADGSLELTEAKRQEILRKYPHW